MMRFIFVALILTACLHAQVFSLTDRGVGAIPVTKVVEVADFDGDAVPDLLHLPSSGFYLSSGRGGGNFDQSRKLGTARPSGPSVAGDFDADGNLDLAILGSSGLSIWLNDGHANFLSKGVAYNWAITEMDAGDFDGDGKDDLLLSDGFEIKIAMNHGNGIFVLTSTQVLTTAKQVLAVDIDGDGQSDAVLGGIAYRGDGKGGLAAISGQSPSGLYTSVAVADFDGDGDLDLVRADGVTTDLLMQSVSGFSLRTSSGLQNLASDVLIAIDADRDGDMDLWCSVGGTAPASHVLRNDGQGAFAVTQTQATGFVEAHAFDANGNGYDDLLLGFTHGLSLGWGMYLNTGSQFEPWGVRFEAMSFGLQAVDMTGDGIVDFLESRPTASASRADLWIATGRGDNSWEESVVLASDVGYLLTAIDLDLDGDLDLSTSTGIYLNLGAGQFQSTGPNQFLFDFVDLDGDGDLDAMSRGPGGKGAQIYLGDGTGKFLPSGTGSIHASFAFMRTLGFGDLNGDGYPELIGCEWGPGSSHPLGKFAAFANDGKARFLTELWSIPLSSLEAVSAVHVGDVDGDGNADMLYELWNLHTGFSIGLLLNDGTGGFKDVSSTHLPSHLFQGRHDGDWVVEDADADGDLDIVTLGSLAQIEVWGNDGTGQFSVAQVIPIPSILYAKFQVEDLDRDGDRDLLIGGPFLSGKLLWGLSRHLLFEGMFGMQARLKVFNTSDRSVPRSVWLFVSTSLLNRPLPISGLGLLGIDVSNAVLLPPVVIPAGQGSVDMTIPIPLSAVVSGTRFGVQAAIQGSVGWGLTNVERMVLVY